MTLWSFLESIYLEKSQMEHGLVSHANVRDLFISVDQYIVIYFVVVRKLDEYESPYISLKWLNEDHRIVLRKW